MADTPSAVNIQARAGRRRLLLATAVVVIVAAAAVLDLAHPFGASPSHPVGHPGSDSTSAADSADPVATQPVTRRTLSAQTTVDATLGYAEDYTVTNQYSGSTSTGGAAGSDAASGGSDSGQGAGQSPSSGAGPSSGSGQAAVVTWLPKPGRVVKQGRVMYRVDGVPVPLLYGSTPAYRTLTEGSIGRDVRQLNHDLVALGYVHKSDVDAAWNQFGWATKAGIEKLQDHFGLDQTGTLDLGSVVFLPTAVRVTAISATVGASIGAGSPVLTGTSTTRQVSIDLDTSEQSEVKVGDHVSVELPNNQTTPGVISAVGTVATSSSSSSAGGSGSSDSSGTSGDASSSGTSTIEVDVRLTHPATAGKWDQAPVEVTITTDTVHNALVVPVVALLAQSGGGYAVEVAAAEGTRHLEPVTLGLFDDADGLVQVTGAGLAAGQRVVVPKL